jgi:membrane fusion protein
LVIQQRFLFRQEALDFQQQHRQWGDVVLIQPLSTKLTSWFLVGCVGLIVALLFFTEYASKETAAGYLTPSSGTARIFASEPGTITAVHVDDGSVVSAGQSLFTVTTRRFTSELGSVEAAVEESLARQRDRLQLRIAAQEELSRHEAARLADLLDGLSAEIRHVEQQIGFQEQRVALFEADFASAGQLVASGVLTEAEHRRREEAHLQQQQNKSELERRAAELRRDLAAARHALDQLPFTLDEQLQVHWKELSLVEQQIAQNQGRHGYTVVAPIDGRITTLQATVGRTADPRHLQMEIVDEHDRMQARLFVPTRAIGFLEIGQQVRLLYDAFPYQSYGVYGGRIASVSRTIVNQGEVSVPVALTEPSYVVTVDLDRPDVEAYGKSIPLQPDMLLTADIVLGKRSLIDWLLDPLRRSGR